MPKYSFITVALKFVFATLLLIGCVEEIREKADQKATVEEVDLHLNWSDLAIGSWRVDNEYMRWSQEESSGNSMTEEEYLGLIDFFSEVFVEIKVDGSYEMGGMIHEQLNGSGNWTINETADTIIFIKANSEPMPCFISFLTQNQFRFEGMIKNRDGSMSKSSWILIRR